MLFETKQYVAFFEPPHVRERNELPVESPYGLHCRHSRKTRGKLATCGFQTRPGESLRFKSEVHPA
jgi:hypothetical protein